MLIVVEDLEEVDALEFALEAIDKQDWKWKINNLQRNQRRKTLWWSLIMLSYILMFGLRDGRREKEQRCKVLGGKKILPLWSITSSLQMNLHNPVLI